MLYNIYSKKYILKEGEIQMKIHISEEYVYNEGIRKDNNEYVGNTLLLTL